MSFTLVEEKKKKKPRQMTLAKLPRKKGPALMGCSTKLTLTLSYLRVDETLSWI